MMKKYMKNKHTQNKDCCCFFQITKCTPATSQGSSGVVDGTVKPDAGSYRFGALFLQLEPDLFRIKVLNADGYGQILIYHVIPAGRPVVGPIDPKHKAKVIKHYLLLNEAQEVLEVMAWPPP